MPAEPAQSAVRQWLAWYLKPLVPTTWQILPTLKSVPTPSRPTVNITHTLINPYPAAPQSDNLINEVVIRITSPQEDIERAEESLDDAVLTLVYALKASERLRWRTAEKVKATDVLLAWDITVEVLTTKPPAEE